MQSAAIRCSRTYYEYAKDICENYRMDLRRYKLIRERKQYIGVSMTARHIRPCARIWHLLQQSLKTVLNDYADLFRKRFSEGLSIRKAADAMQHESRRDRAAADRAVSGVRRSFCSSGMRRTASCRLIAGN